MTTLTFVLERAARVVFTVKQLSPACGTVGGFTVRAHAGLNRVRFAGRVGGRPLGAGTYRITARTVAGRTVQRVLLVVVDGSAPTRTELTALRASNICSATRETASTASNPTAASGATNVLAHQDVGRSLSPKEPSSALGPASGGSNDRAGGVLASTVERTARAVRPVLVALLALSILLLGLASLPQVAVADPRFTDVLARHRLEIAGVGTAALFAVVITFLVA